MLKKNRLHDVVPSRTKVDFHGLHFFSAATANTMERLLPASHSMTYQYYVPSTVGTISTPPAIENLLNTYELSSATSQALKV